MKRYFGSLSFYRQALMIGVPVMLQSLIQSLVSLVDNFMVAGLGDVKMKAERRQISREQRDAEAQRRFEMKQLKKKEKRRGH